MITFYYNLAPNPMKVALCLEEMAFPYELKPVDTRKGEQHQSDFLAINPNGKVPVIIDQDTGARVFDSNAILRTLAAGRIPDAGGIVFLRSSPLQPAGARPTGGAANLR